MKRLRSEHGSTMPIESSSMKGTHFFGAILWPSFFAAGVATMWFFAAVDPIELAAITWPRLEMSRELGYTIGFFMFWLCTGSACLFTAVLMHPPSPVRGARVP